MMTPLNSYDEIPYDSHPFPQTHPDRLATLATLFGLPHPPLHCCRVLELGCAAGGNLIPLAEQLPEGEFVGVDLSSKQIADGQGIVDALGYRNVQLKAASIADVDASWGQFDYIICHGVYSWVPQLIQDKILSICQDRLNPDGIAYVSYNTLPGWRMRGMIRDLMRHHALGFSTPTQQVEQARAILDFLVQAVPSENSAYSLLLKGELDLLRHMPDAYIYHEHLETVNEPIYFREFVERAAQHSLKYLAEADFTSMLASRFPPQVAETVQRIAPDIIGQEQLMDFVCNRTFRQSLLVHDQVKVERNIPLARIDQCRVASYLSPISDKPSFAPESLETFKLANGVAITTQTPLTKAALSVLAKCGYMSLSWQELLDKARKMLMLSYVPNEQEVDRLRADLMQCFFAGTVSLHRVPSVFSATPVDKPCASKLARYQALTLPAVTNLRHEQVTLDLHARTILGWLDGLSSIDSLLNRFNQGYPQLPDSAFNNLLQGLADGGLLRINPQPLKL